MKFLIVSAFMGLAVFAGSVLQSDLPPDGPVLFESSESKTSTGGAVFNRVQFLPGKERDVWLMQQTHRGLASGPLSFAEWDRLAIVVDKTKKTAIFYELAPGSLAFEPKPVPFKARCFACHPNGPRAIRWNHESGEATPGFWGRLKVAYWNFRIARYGKLGSLPAAQFSEGSPFQGNLPILARPLALRSCTKCHSENGIRSELKMEHLASASFLVASGAMPPFPFRISKKDQRRLTELSGAKETFPLPELTPPSERSRGEEYSR